jgi:hypothetical protein
MAETDQKPRKTYKKRVIPMGQTQPEPHNSPGVMTLPHMPTNGKDLVAAWGLPSRAWDEGGVKVTRVRQGTTQLELIEETSVGAYSLERVAAMYGAASYVILLSGDPAGEWTQKNCKVTISPEYASACGYSAVPQIPAKISEARNFAAAAESLRDGSARLNAGDLASLVESVAERAAAAVCARMPQPQPTIAQDPALQFQSMFSIFGMLQSMQDKALEKALALAGLNVKAPESDRETSWPEVAMEAVPVLKELAGAFLASREPAPVQPTPTAQAAILEDPPMKYPLSMDEVRSMVQAVAMLRPFVPQLLEIVKKEITPEIGIDIAGYIPGPLRGQLADLAGYVSARGVECLAVVDQRLATQQGAALLAAIVAAFREQK